MSFVKCKDYNRNGLLILSDEQDIAMPSYLNYQLKQLQSYKTVKSIFCPVPRQLPQIRPNATPNAEQFRFPSPQSFLTSQEGRT